MSPSKLLLALLLPFLAALPAHAAVPARAEELARVFGLPITNSMVTTWVVAIILIVAIRVAVRRPTLIPSHAQAVIEGLVEGIKGLIAPIVGPRVVTATFPLLVALFIYILAQNWSGLFPGVGTIGYGHATPTGFLVVEPIIRPGMADMNGTIALALVSFIAWFYFIMRYAGPKVVAHDIFGNKAERQEVSVIIYYLLFPIFLAVGLIEVISILFRPVSLSFRLFGNVFGGENLLHAMSGIFKWGLPVPFYFLEILIGFVQALVFTLLVSVYIGLICNHGDDTHEPGKAAH